MGRGMDSIIAQGLDAPLIPEEPADEPLAVKDEPAAEPTPVVEDDKADKDKKPETEKKPAEVKPKVEEVKAAQFAALARKRGEVKEREEAVTASRVALDRDASTFQQSVQRFNADVQRFQQERETYQAALSTKEGFFATAEKIGITAEDVLAWANGKGPTAKERAKYLTPDDLARERAQWKAEQDRERQQWTGQQRQRDAETAFLAVANDETKFEAANFVYSETERLRHANEIASEASARGLNWGYAEVAAALNELAEQDNRWLKYSQARKSTGAAPITAAGKAGTRRPEGRPNSNDHAQDRDQLNGARRRKHDDRLASVLTKADRLNDS